MNKSLIFGLVFVILLASAVSAKAVIPVYDCQVLDKPNRYYQLKNDVSLEPNEDICFTVTANGVTLNMAGHSIIGSNEWGHGILNDGFDGLIIKNGKLSKFSFGIRIMNSSNNLLSDLSVTESRNGIYLVQTSNSLLKNSKINSGTTGIETTGIYLINGINNTLIDITSQNNSRDVALLAETDDQCQNTLNNVTVSENKKLFYFNEQISLSNFNAGAIILCGADNSTLTNLNISNTNHNNGLYIVRTDDSIFSNLKITGTYDGIFILDSDNNLVTSSTSTNNYYAGIGVWGENNKIIGNKINNNYYAGILAYFATNSVIKDNYIEYNSFGIYFDENEPVATGIHVYNNLFRNTINFRADYEGNPNTWTEALTSGFNIIGGSYIGGNFWANPSGTGFSETCEDENNDGICDESYTIAEGNIDYLPLTLKKVDFTDVAVDSITISPKEPQLGDNVKVSIILKNLGRMTTNVTYTTGITAPNGGFGGGNCPYCLQLRSNETHLISLSFIASLPGQYSISANIVNSLIPDNKIQNNQLSLNFTI